ncbi:hypothetical protein ACFQE5_05425 [Pseudonocardia hispaniensis]|uniref:Uncharacterized protein n=1 Tax=Pseudonocardia hispaniensis TaxID=904933 RepID=A0ABW1IZC6_9PSEU
MLEIARLTPAQALVLAIDVLAAPPIRGQGGPRGGSAGYAVVVGADGLARLTAEPEHPSSDGHRPVPASLGEATPLADLAAAARRSVREPDQRESEQLAALDRAAVAAAEPGANRADVTAPLRAVSPSDGDRRRRAELARLVRAANGCPAGTTAPLPPAPRAARPAAPPTPPLRNRSGARSVAARSWRWGISIVVLAAVLLLEIIFLRDRISHDIGVVLDAGRAGAATTTARPTPPPVAPPAPRAAGAVAGVDLRALYPCTPGSDCQIRLQVLLHPQPDPQTVAWDLRIVNPCTGAAAAGPAGTVAVPPNGERAVVVDTVSLPPGDALAVLAQVSTPAVAASAPLPVPVLGTCTAVPPEPSR